LTLPTLEGIDRETLASLQKKCHALTERLGSGSRGSWNWLLGIFLFLAAGASFFLIQGVGDLHLPSITSLLALIQRNPLFTLAILVPAVLLASVVLLNWLLRAPTAARKEP
jgi:hypothetical protein